MSDAGPRGRGRLRPAPPRRVKRRDETSLRGGAIGILVVVAAILAISIVGGLIALVISWLY